MLEEETTQWGPLSQRGALSAGSFHFILSFLSVLAISVATLYWVVSTSPQREITAIKTEKLEGTWPVFSSTTPTVVEVKTSKPQIAQPTKMTQATQSTGDAPKKLVQNPQAPVQKPLIPITSLTPLPVVMQPLPIPQNSPVPVTQPPTSATYTYPVGISVGATLSGLSSSELDARLSDIASLGITWLRFDIDWSGVQHTSRTKFDWADTDRIVSHARAHGLAVLPILAFTPPWARLSDCSWTDKCRPSESVFFADFARAAALRYAPQGVHTWEIWNEPNIPQFWMPAPNAGDYAVILKASSEAIKSADPSATIVSGSLASTNTSGSAISQLDFLEDLYASGAASYFDAVGYHPYSFPALASNNVSWSAWSKMSKTARSIHSIMVSAGDSHKKIWITEYGAPTNGPGLVATEENGNFAAHPDHVNEGLQAAMVGDTLSEISGYSWAGPLFWYTYKDAGTDPSNAENFYGILRRDGTHKPAYDALKRVLTGSI